MTSLKGMQRADYKEAVEAARRWMAAHGLYPQQQEWEHRAPGRPTTRTKRRWGRRLELLCALRRAREEMGRWPSAGEWEFATREHVSRRAYVRQFGTWRRACRTAARLKLL